VFDKKAFSKFALFKIAPEKNASSSIAFEKIAEFNLVPEKDAFIAETPRKIASSASAIVKSAPSILDREKFVPLSLAKTNLLPLKSDRCI